MNYSSVRVLFSEHGAVGDKVATIAGLEVNKLIEMARLLGIHLIRVCDPAEVFDRALLHLGDSNLDAFLAARKFPFVALRVTTERPGIPLSRPHLRSENPSRIVLFVRRMEALRDLGAWGGFLRASEDDCGAVCENRLFDMSDEARPMLRLFAEHEKVIPALVILCSAFEEVCKRAARDGSFWQARAKEAQQAQWWLQALNRVTVTLPSENKNREGEELSWEDARQRGEAKAVAALIQRISLEALRWNSKSDREIKPLIDAVARDANVNINLVEKASAELSKILG